MLHRLFKMTRFSAILALPTALIVMASTAQALLHSHAAPQPFFDSVIMFAAPGYDPEAKEYLNGYCNGTLLNTQVIITAAHCVAQASLMPEKPLDLQPGQYLYHQRENQPARRIGWGSKHRQQIKANYYFFPSFADKLKRKGLLASPGPSEDIAIIFLHQPLQLPENWPTAKLVKTKLLPSIINSLPEQNLITVSVNPMTEIATNDLRRMGPITQIEKSFFGYLSSKGRGRVEPGDSGSPLFVYSEQEWKIIGITKGLAGNMLFDWDVYGIADNRVCDLLNKVSKTENLEINKLMEACDSKPLPEQSFFLQQAPARK